MYAIYYINCTKHESSSVCPFHKCIPLVQNQFLWVDTTDSVFMAHAAQLVSLTWVLVSKLPAHHGSISGVPTNTRHSPPHPIDTHLHSPLISVCSSNQANITTAITLGRACKCAHKWKYSKVVLVIFFVREGNEILFLLAKSCNLACSVFTAKICNGWDWWELLSNILVTKVWDGNEIRIMSALLLLTIMKLRYIVHIFATKGSKHLFAPDFQRHAYQCQYSNKTQLCTGFQNNSMLLS